MQVNYSTLPAVNLNIIGAAHHDDLLYLFAAPLVAPTFNRSDPENLIIERLTRLWIAFAIKG